MLHTLFESSGRVGLFIDGFDVQFKNGNTIIAWRGLLSGFLYKIRSSKLVQISSIKVPDGLDVDKLRAAANYFYGQWEKIQKAEQKGEQKLQEEKERIEKRKKRLETRWKGQSGGRNGEDSTPID